MKKISAFTITELVVVMLISSILFGIAYASLQIIQDRYSYFAKVSERMLEMNRLRVTLNYDFARASYVAAAQKSIIFYGDTLGLSYHFGEEYILRQHRLSIDTFYLESQSMECFMLGEKLPGNEGVADELRFEYWQEEEVFRFHFRKQYDAAQLMKLNL